MLLKRNENKVKIDPHHQIRHLMVRRANEDQCEPWFYLMPTAPGELGADDVSGLPFSFAVTGNGEATVWPRADSAYLVGVAYGEKFR